MGANEEPFNAFDVHNLMLMIKLSSASHRETAHLWYSQVTVTVREEQLPTYSIFISYPTH